MTLRPSPPGFSPVPAAPSADLEWNPGFRQTVDWVQGSRDPLFITGRAGSGKSTLLRYLARHILRDPVVLAPTGVAALAVGGETLHSFFRFPPRVLFSWEEGFGRRELLRRLDTLVIDEISLVRSDAFAAMERALRRHGPEPGAPFGGVRLVLFGDLHQLPPVWTRAEGEALASEQPGPWFFQSEAFRRLRFRRIFLGEVYRQRDGRFLDRLERARLAEPDEEDLAAWNGRVGEAGDAENPQVLLAATNAAAETVNLRALADLSGAGRSYAAEKEGAFDASASPAPALLHLRVGAQVMFLRNHPERLWVNGTLGKVANLEEESVWVIPAGKPDAVRVGREIWKRIGYEEDPETGRIREKELGRCRQFPLKPAWALTVHKSQGKEFDRVRIDLGRGAFAHGQAYVALSRCRSFEGLSLHRPLRREDFRLDPAVREFLE